MRLIQSMAMALVLGLGISAGMAAVPAENSKAASVSSITRVNLNTATVKDLKAVPGLNLSKARALVAYRKLNGPYASLETLQKVSGFKRMDAKRLQELKAHLVLSQ